jgi:polysaccharide biosynthesis/export protein
MRRRIAFARLVLDVHFWGQEFMSAMDLRSLHCILPSAILLGSSLAFAAGQTTTAAATETSTLLRQAPSAEGDSAAATANPTSADHRSQYVLGPADVIHVNVWKNTDLSETVTVDPNGFVSLPLLGDIHVAGMTTNQIAADLDSRFTAYVVSPQVTVSIVDIRSRQAYVMGKVGKPGGYPLMGPITVLQLIAQAGGLTPYAKRKDIYVLRTANGRVQKFPFNYDKVARGSDLGNIVLQPGDTVIIP